MGGIQVQEGQDPPEVGQWWVNEYGKRMHIVGKTADGTFVLEFPSGGVYRDHGNWMKCRHLEGCDSWDWFEFPDSAGDGYRFIDKKADEKNVADEFWSSSQQKWVPIHNPLSTWDKTSVYRRKVEPPAPVETFPQWYERNEFNHPDVICIRRDNRELFTAIYKSGTEISLSTWVPAIDGERRKLTAEQAQEMIRHAVESPDDWLRYDCKGMQVTCQRKALDPAKPLPTHERYDKHSRNWIPVYSPATIPVRLWVSERITYESGDWPVRCGVEPPSGPGSWSEIFPSPDGFFVKKQS